MHFSERNLHSTVVVQVALQRSQHFDVAWFDVVRAWFALAWVHECSQQSTTCTAVALCPDDAQLPVCIGQPLEVQRRILDLNNSRASNTLV